MKTLLVTGNFNWWDPRVFFLRETKKWERGSEEEGILQLRLKGEEIGFYALHHRNDTHCSHRTFGVRGLQI